MVGVAGACLLLLAAESPVASALAGASPYWGIGAEAVLPANAAATPEVSIASVSCGSAGNCSAVGSYFDTSSHYEGLLLDEVGGVWERGVEAALPANASGANGYTTLSSVSCPSAGNCTAVGSYEDTSGNSEGLLLTETAGVWAAGVEAVLPADASTAGASVALSSVSCASAGNCSAVGSYVATGSRFEGLLLSESDGVWATGVEAVLPANADASFPNASLSSVSCGSPGNCSAVGVYNLEEGQGMATTSRGLLLTEKDGSWGAGVEPVLPPSGESDSVMLNSVSCASAGNCVAVGLYNDSSGLEGLLLTESAGAWETGSKAVPPADASSYPIPSTVLNSVSCPSAGNCAAVGTYVGSSTTEGVLLTETAGKWSTGVRATLPPDADPEWGFGLHAISCASAGNCTAVGYYSDSLTYEGVSGDEGLLVTASDGVWSDGTEVELPADAPIGGQAGLTSVSCPTADSCSGVGSYGAPNILVPISDQGLLVSTTATPPQSTLSVSEAGAGSGAVASSPAGIECASSCAAGFTIGAEVTLTATPAANSDFSGWSGGGCSGTGTCQVPTKAEIGATTTVTAEFSLKPCIVPRLKSKSLAAAKRSIKSHECSVGTIKHAHSRTVRKGHVTSQKPKPGTRLKQGARINLTVSSGRRH